MWGLCDAYRIGYNFLLVECYLAEINAFHLYVNGIIHDIFPLANTSEFYKNVNVMALFYIKFRIQRQRQNLPDFLPKLILHMGILWPKRSVCNQLLYYDVL